MTAGSAAAEGTHLSLGGVCSRHHSRIIYHITSGAKFAHANPSAVAQHDGFLISREIGKSEDIREVWECRGSFARPLMRTT
jgi:hypothetical protein